jgi:hypothetical protein
LEVLGILEVRPVNPLKTLGETEVARLGKSENIGGFEERQAEATREEAVIASIKHQSAGPTGPLKIFVGFGSGICRSEKG